MTEEQRRKEICEIVELVDQVATLSNQQLMEVLGIPVVVATLGDSSEQIEAVDGDVGIAERKDAGRRRWVRHVG